VVINFARSFYFFPRLATNEASDGERQSFQAKSKEQARGTPNED